MTGKVIMTASKNFQSSTGYNMSFNEAHFCHLSSSVILENAIYFSQRSFFVSPRCFSCLPPNFILVSFLFHIAFFCLLHSFFFLFLASFSFFTYLFIIIPISFSAFVTQPDRSLSTFFLPILSIFHLNTCLWCRNHM